MMAKKIIIILLVILSGAGSVYCKTGEQELGRRYLKLGNTYREAGNDELSIKYLNKGYTIVKKYSDFYWIAVAEEYLAYYYLDKKDYSKALKYLYSAKSIFDVYGKLRNNEGSNNAIVSMIESIESMTPDGKEITPPDKDTPGIEKKPVKKTKTKVKGQKSIQSPKHITGTRNKPKEKEASSENIRIGDEMAEILSKKPEDMELSSEEKKLYDMIMEYRSENGLPQIPLSKSLTYVAKVHTIDLEYNFVRGTECNGHSWSDNGRWTPVCYTPDHKYAALVWSKPAELTEYPGKGYEIAFWKSDFADAESALKGWQGSVLHDNMVINRENWKDNKWNAIGVAIFDRYSCVWFGEEEDPVK